MFLRRWMAPTHRMIGSRAARRRGDWTNAVPWESRGSWMVPRAAVAPLGAAVNAETAMIKSDRSAAARACAVKRCAEFGRRVVARDHEQIVEGGDACGGDGPCRGAGSVRETDRRRARDSPEQAAGGVAGKAIGERAQEAMGAVAKQKRASGMSARQAE